MNSNNNSTDEYDERGGTVGEVKGCDLWKELVEDAVTRHHLSTRLETVLRNLTVNKELVCEISQILLDICRKQIISVLVEWDTSKHYSVEVDISELAERNQWLVNRTSTQADLYLNLYDIALAKAQVDLIKQNDASVRELKYKPKCSARLYVEEAMLAADETQIRKMPRSDEVGSWRVLRSTVLRAGAVKLAEFLRMYECNKCNSRWIVESVRELHNSISAPVRCPFNNSTCKYAKIVQINSNTGANLEFCKDYQEIRVQEPINRTRIGMIPRCINVILEDDLVDQCQPGDEVLICGYVIRRFKFQKGSERCEAEVSMVANHIRVISDYRNAFIQLTTSLIKRFEDNWTHWKIINKEFEERDRLLKNFCSGIYGMYLVKLAVFLVLVGGVENTSHEIKIRGDPHLLLVGDPGTGKSQILRYASRMGTRCVLTNSVGTTNAGLTCAAVKDGGEWQLEAGALVLADRGICLIDEFGALRSHDRDAIHEAMEQQTISVAKAGIVCKLNARCAVIAACNPKGKFDPSLPMEINVALAGPLLSRFDLIFILVDLEDEEWDTYLANFVVDCHMNNPLPYNNIPDSSKKTSNDINPQSSTPSDKCINALEWTPEIIQSYIAHVKTMHPKLGKTARDVLTAYYQLQRMSITREASRTTIRLLESLIRLSQAHARLMMHDSVSIEDAIVAIVLTENSLMNLFLLKDTPVNDHFTLKSNFLADPDVSINLASRIILEKLQLPQYIPMLSSTDL